MDTLNNNLKGLVFDIQGQSVHDGPGSRTTVFLNGCPLHCLWCANPEGLHRKPILMHSKSRCKACGRCISSCEKKAISLNEIGELVFDRTVCDHCEDMVCVSNCYYEGLTVNGKWYSDHELISRLERDTFYWGTSGGVSFSGGEPLLHFDFVQSVFAKCKERKWHLCVETTANIKEDNFKKLMSYVDWVFVDLKHMDSSIHRNLTGVGNELIFKNLAWLAGDDNWNGFCVIRIPIIPGQNDSDENIIATAKFVKSIGLEVINILPFHRLGVSKYEKLGKEYPFAHQGPPTPVSMQKIKGLIESIGLTCFSGDETPF